MVPTCCPPELSRELRCEGSARLQLVSEHGGRQRTPPPAADPPQPDAFQIDVESSLLRDPSMASRTICACCSVISGVRCVPVNSPTPGLSQERARPLRLATLAGDWQLRSNMASMTHLAHRHTRTAPPGKDRFQQAREIADHQLPGLEGDLLDPGRLELPSRQAGQEQGKKVPHIMRGRENCFICILPCRALHVWSARHFLKFKR